MEKLTYSNNLKDPVEILKNASNIKEFWLKGSASIEKLMLCNIFYNLIVKIVDEYSLNYKFYLKLNKMYFQKATKLNLLNTEYPRLKQIFHNIKRWNLDWFREISFEPIEGEVDEETKSDKIAMLKRSPLAQFLKTTLNLIMLDKDSTFNIDAMKFLKEIMINEYLNSELLVNVINQKGYLVQQDRRKGREGLIIKMSYNPFAELQWSNILAIVFSFFRIQETFKYRSLSKVFNKAIQSNAKMLTHMETSKHMREDVKRFKKKNVHITF